MTSSAIVQKLWNYCNVLRDDPSAPDCEHRSGRCEHAQVDGDYPSTSLRTGSEQLTYLLFLKTVESFKE